MINNRRNAMPRRQFIETAVKGAAASVAAVHGFPTVVSASVFGRNAPSNRINVGEIERRSASLPTADKIRESLGLDDKPVIAILAGSRKSEITQVLPRMLEVVEQFPEYQFVLAGVRNLPDELYTKVIGRKNVGIIKDRTYEILRISHAALVTSGTATLETALFNVPQVVCYRGDFISMVIAWFVIKVKYISLVNLIMGKEVVKELVQYSLNRKNLYKELKSIVEGGVRRKQMLADYKKLNEIIGPSGASGRTARDMVKCLKG